MHACICMCVCLCICVCGGVCVCADVDTFSVESKILGQLMCLYNQTSKNYDFFR